MTSRRSARQPPTRKLAPDARLRNPSEPAFVPPYRPSWVDRFTDWVDRLPGPAWLPYLVLALAGAGYFVAVQVIAGGYRPGSYLTLHLWLGADAAYLLGMLHLLDHAAADALEAFRPVLILNRPSGQGASPVGSTFEEVRYRLTTLPAGLAWVAALLGAVFGLGFPLAFIHPGAPAFSLMASMATFAVSPVPGASAAILAEFVVTQAIAGILVYHSIHQLRTIHLIYRDHSGVNLYRLQPLYAFSVPSALTAGGWVLYSSLWFIAAPGLLREAGSLAMAAFFVLVAAVTFTWPLLGIHRRLQVEKRVQLAESNQRFEAAVIELRHRFDQQRLTRMDDLHKAMASLDLEQAALRRIPTWPWETGTLRSVIAALVLPIVIWLVQFGLGMLLG